MTRVTAYSIVVLFLAASAGVNCQPTFDAAVTYPLPQEAQTIAIGDLNGDGRDDVAVTAWPSALYVLYQQEDGTLGPPISLWAPNSPLGLAIADINGDGRKDLAVGGSSGIILLYYQLASGTFGLPDAGWGYGLVSSIAIDDFSNDGLPDLASTSADSPTVLVSLQLPGGTFGLPASYWIGGYNARCLCALDYNSDGQKDLALLTDDTTCYLAGSPTGDFAPPQYISTPWAYALAAGDVTGDQRGDLVLTIATNQPDAAVIVVPQGPDGLPAPAWSHPAYDFAQPLAVFDLDKDGRCDVVAAHGGYEAITTMCQSTEGALDQWTHHSAPYCNRYQPGALAVGDLNSDGFPDVALADWWNGVTVLLQTPTVVVDNTAPVCSAQLYGTFGGAGWYRSAVIVTLEAADEADGAGVSDILFTRDGVSWGSYDTPVIVSDEGVTSIGFRAMDNAGNESVAQWIEIKVDTTPPVVSLQPQVTEIWPPTGGTVNVPVIIQAGDAASGVASLRLSVADEYGLVEPQLDVVAGSTVLVPLVASRDEADRDGRVYALTLTCTDQAGNVSEAEAEIVVPHSKSPKPKKNKK